MVRRNPLSMRYHLNSAFTPRLVPAVGPRGDYQPTRWEQEVGVNADTPRCDLPAATPLTAPLGSLLARRRSARMFEWNSLSLTALSTLLHYAAGCTAEQLSIDGVTRRQLRVYPSAGALYPVDLYVLARDVPGLEPALYIYRPEHHCLYLLDRSPDLPDRVLASSPLTARVPGGPAVEAFACPLLVFQVASFDRAAKKYGERGYRFVLLEAGHMAQTISLVALALSLGSVFVGGFFDTELNRTLGLDGVSRAALACIPIGFTRSVASSPEVGVGSPS